ncbi:hypothetical protein P8T57_10640 [Thalassospira sp. SN3W]|uniref:hypothetical protein n=1 Tax=Thalassospira sp. SN3W TaxID=3035476 RepID=UPI00311B327C
MCIDIGTAHGRPRKAFAFLNGWPRDAQALLAFSMFEKGLRPNLNAFKCPLSDFANLQNDCPDFVDFVPSDKVFKTKAMRLAEQQ